MKPRFALSTRIFLLAFANLLLLAVVAATFARYQLGMDFNSRQIGLARDRVISMARQIALDLEETPIDERNGLLQRYGKSYGVAFYLFRQPGDDQVAGPDVTLPEEVRAALRRPPPPKREGPEGRGAGRGRGRGEADRELQFKSLNHDEEPPPEERPERRAPDGAPPLFEVSTNTPSLHWVGAGIPLRDPDSHDHHAGIVLMSAPSFVGTPLFFDYKPWLWLTAAMVAAFIVCWLPFIRGLTRTVKQMNAATEQLAEGHFEQHLHEKRRDELGLLAGNINRMAGRLSGFVTGQKRFLGDIAHELCAPIARIQFALGILERKTEPGATNDLQDEVKQMSDLVSELLSFSKAGILAVGKPLIPVAVEAPVREAVQRESALAGVEIQVNLEPGLFALADREQLSRAVSNLVRNAIRYAGEAGPISVQAQRHKSEVVITVADSGPGLPEEEADRVFAPFYRLENSRNRASGGVGLGLAIVQKCVEACQGKVRCRNRVPTGLEVEIRLRAAENSSVRQNRGDAA